MKKVLFVLLAFFALTFTSCDPNPGTVSGPGVIVDTTKVDTSKVQSLTKTVDTATKKVDSVKSKLKK